MTARPGKRLEDGKRSTNTGYLISHSYEEAMKYEVFTVLNSDFDRKADNGRTDGNNARHDDRDDSFNNNSKRCNDDKRVSFKEDDKSSSEGRYL